MPDPRARRQLNSEHPGPCDRGDSFRTCRLGPEFCRLGPIEALTVPPTIDNGALPLEQRLTAPGSFTYERIERSPSSSSLVEGLPHKPSLVICLGQARPDAPRSYVNGLVVSGQGCVAKWEEDCRLTSKARERYCR
jgi:hypothetical protein